MPEISRDRGSFRGGRGNGGNSRFTIVFYRGIREFSEIRETIAHYSFSSYSSPKLREVPLRGGGVCKPPYVIARIFILRLSEKRCVCMKICGNLPLSKNWRLPQTAGSYRLLSAPHRYWNKEDPHGFRCDHTTLRQALKSKSSGWRFVNSQLTIHNSQLFFRGGC